MTKWELENELIMRNANWLWYQFIQLLIQSKSTVRSEKGKTLVGQLNCLGGWWGKSKGRWGNSPPLHTVKNALQLCLQQVINRIEEWCDKWLLKLNISKCKTIVLHE